MEKAGCVNGELDTTRYASPIPIIGLYIAVATLVCFLSMAFDLLYGFIRKKPYLPCKLFPLNSLTMTILAVATKIPVDLTTIMPRAEDQLSKLTSTALLCISTGFFMPSLGNMEVSERFANMAALSIMVITVLVNVCIQIVTGVIFAFAIEHVIIMGCMLVLLILLWSSTLSIKGHRENLLNRYNFQMGVDLRPDPARGVQRLRQLLEKYYLCSYSGNPQSLLCQTTHCHTTGLLCALTTAIVLEASLRSFAFKESSFCSGVSDYRWSILLVVVTQILTILVGGFTVISRGLTMLNHMSLKERLILSRDHYRTMELHYLRFEIPSFKFHRKSTINIFRAIKDFIIDVLIALQNGVHWGTELVVIPFFYSRKLLAWMVMNMSIEISFRICNSHNHTEDVGAMVSSVSEIKKFVIIFEVDSVLQNWITQIALEDMVRWMKVNKKDSPTHLIQLLYKTDPQSQSVLMEGLQVTARNLLMETIYEYRVSCVSVLVLARMLVNVMPSPLKESLIQSLYQSFQIIYFIDWKTNTPSSDDELRWMAARDVWVGWDNPNHWYQTKVMEQTFRSNSKKPSDEPSEQGRTQEESELHQALCVIRSALEIIERYVETTSENFLNFVFELGSNYISLDKRIHSLIILELVIICKFILEQEYTSIAELYDFMELTFGEMLHFFLPSLPLAILKEIGGDPYEVGEERVRNAMKFFCKLELIGDNVQWLWPTEFDTRTQNNPLLSPVSTRGTTTVASGHGTELKANVSTVSTTQDEDNNTAPLS